MSQKISGRENENGDEVNHEETEITIVKVRIYRLNYLLLKSNHCVKVKTVVCGIIRYIFYDGQIVLGLAADIQ